MRHTFALSFLRTDGNVFNLQYILGHNSLEMVRIYTATLGMEDALRAHIEASPADHLGYSIPETVNREVVIAGQKGERKIMAEKKTKVQDIKYK
jgi:hypothetical protein